MANATKLTGTPIGVPGSWGNRNNDYTKVFDGNSTTFYDALNETGDWCGLNLGSPFRIQKVSFTPRKGFEGRMVGGVFQAADDAAFTKNVRTLGTVKTTPSFAPNNLDVAGDFTAQFVRYLGPPHGQCNIAELEFYGMAVLVPVAVPAGQISVVTPTPTPTATPFIIGVGSNRSTSGDFTAMQAPAAVHFDASGICTKEDVISWNFGDSLADVPFVDPRFAENSTIWTAPTASLNTSIIGRTCSHLYQNAGQYNVTLTITSAATGSVTTITRKVIVPISTRTKAYFNVGGNDSNPVGNINAPWASPTKFAAFLNNQSNVEVHIANGYTIDLTQLPTIQMAKNVWIDNKGTLKDNGNAFAGWDGITDGFVISGGNWDGVNNGWMIEGRGDNIAVDSMTFGGGSHFVYGEDKASRGLLIQRCKQTSNTGSVVIGVFAGDGTNAADNGAFYQQGCIYANVICGSDGENTFRTEGTGAADGWDVEFNDVKTATKSAMVNRNAKRVTTHGNVWRWVVSTSSTINTIYTSVQDAKWVGDHFTAGAYLDLRGRGDGYLISNCYFADTTTPGVHLASTLTSPLTNIKFVDSNGPGAKWFMYQDVISSFTTNMPQATQA